MTELRNKSVTVAGLGRFGGGIAVARWLVSQGARVLVTDRASASELAASLEQLAGLPVEYRFGEHRREDFTNADLIVASPAIPPTSEYLRAAEDSGVPITTEIVLFLERNRCPVIGVTGTKGKSTTTAMIGMMCSTQRRTFVGGNIGASLLNDLPNLRGDSDLVVLELSSYMLHYTPAIRFAPHIAVVTMITADHLDWHGGLTGYVDAKRNLVRFQSPSDHAVLNRHDPVSATFEKSTKAQVHWFPPTPVAPIDLQLRGAHNQTNALAALVAARCAGIEEARARDAVRAFGGLPHRLQTVRTVRGITFVNDSIATGPDAAVAACESFPEGTVLQIVGGYDKHLDLGKMCHTLAKRCKCVLTIGALMSQLAQGIRNESGCEVVESGNLETALAEALVRARPGDTVLLSPGCASYDHFPNFEHRGEAFVRLVNLVQ